MAKIKRLALEEIKKIAAGQVVERPATVVKELVENALDAGATEITLFVRDGGNSFIRVVDNGCGMSPEDAHLACATHATSKIIRLDDLQTLTTYGFRGEALASIAAVSSVVLITRERGHDVGTCLVLSCGEQKEVHEVSCPTGTDIAVSELFVNVPARKKFLKTAETELRMITTLMQSFIIAHQPVHFKIFNNDSLVYNCPPVATVEMRFTQLFDRVCSQQLVPFVFEEKSVQLAGSGVVSRLQYMRYNSAQIFLFINKRWIKNIGLMRAVLKGYNGALPHGRYPAAALFVETDPALIDVNIHPRKEEIKFVHEHKIEHLVQQAVKTCLSDVLAQQLHSSPLFSGAPSPVSTVSADFVREMPKTRDIDAQRANMPTPIFTPGRVINEEELFVAPPVASFSAPQIRSYKFIGHCYQTYLMLEKNEELIFIDQHAAHERILYERMISKKTPVQPVVLLFPHTVTLNANALKLLTVHADLLIQHGIIGDCMGTDRFVIKQVPVYLKHINFTELIRELVSFLEDANDQEEKFMDRFDTHICTQMACKAAVKAGDELSLEKIYEILDQLEKIDNRMTCPHGRPTSWTLHKSELEKKFRRDYTK